MAYAEGMDKRGMSGRRAGGVRFGTDVSADVDTESALRELRFCLPFLLPFDYTLATPPAQNSLVNLSGYKIEHPILVVLSRGDLLLQRT